MLRRAAASFSFALTIFGVTTQLAFAASGTIISPNQYAWDDNGGYVNWNATGGNVAVTDTALTGYIWSAGFGWINLAPTMGGVTNSGGMLGGWAWAENTGWINFTGVTIDSSGTFHGQTTPQSTFGTMSFDCTYCTVTTTWRISSGSSPSTQAATAGGNGPPAQSGPISYGYQTAAISASSSSANTPATTNVPTSLIPTSPPPIIEPSPKPSASRTPPKNSQLSPPLKLQQTPAATTTATAPPPNPAAERPAISRPIAPSVSTTLTCSWLTCWLQGFWKFVQSYF